MDSRRLRHRAVSNVSAAIRCEVLQIVTHRARVTAFSLYLLAVGGSACASSGEENATHFRFNAQGGAYAVGLRVIDQVDAGRSYGYRTNEAGTRRLVGPRPMQTLMWYPATPGNLQPMSVRDYTDLWKSEWPGQDDLPQAGLRWKAALSPSLFDRLWAVRDAQPVAGRFPVVIYSPSWADLPTPWENADLCEYLASYGYVVLAVPNLGPTHRRMTADVRGVNAQAQDVSYLIGFANSLPNADPTHVAAVGFSWGGLAALYAAARDRRIDALVALDGSMRYFPGLIQKLADVDVAQITIPLMYFAEGDFSLEDEERDIPESDRTGPNVLNAWTHGDLIMIRMLGLTHKGFSSMYQRSEETWAQETDSGSAEYKGGDYTRAEAAASYAWVTRYTRAFLNAYLKHDREAMAFLRGSPAQNGVPAHLMAMTIRNGAGVPPSYEGLRAEVGRQGFDNIAAVLERMRNVSPLFTVSIDEMSAWADELVEAGHFKEATAVAILNTTLHPDAGQAYLDLGDVYGISGQSQSAAESYRRALKLEPSLLEARYRLREVENHRSQAP